MKPETTLKSTSDILAVHLKFDSLHLRYVAEYKYKANEMFSFSFFFFCEQNILKLQIFRYILCFKCL